MNLRTIAPLALLLATSISSVALADLPKRLKATWKVGEATTDFKFKRSRDKTSYRAQTRSPAKDVHRLELRQKDGKWELKLHKRIVIGMSERVRGSKHRRYRWQEAGAVELRREGNRLVGDETWSIEFPLDPEATPSTPGDSGPSTAKEDGLAGTGPVRPSTDDARPVVRVLLTGFDRFPRLQNHPTYATYSGVLEPFEQRQPAINPSGWSVRAFDPGKHLPAELHERYKIVVFKLNDLPVVYVDAAAAVVSAIERLKPDVVISTGVGANSGADADVESKCFNEMHDNYGFGGDRDKGPFQLPTSWPPQKPMAEWSQEDRVWLSRYPDNAGVSYSGKKIWEEGPEELTSTLPVQQIVHAVEKAGLRAIDGGPRGPGRYVCNNVMYQVVRTQRARSKLGGFIHMKRWSETRKDEYLKILTLAIQESAKALHPVASEPRIGQR